MSFKFEILEIPQEIAEKVVQRKGRSRENDEAAQILMDKKMLQIGIFQESPVALVQKNCVGMFELTLDPTSNEFVDGACLLVLSTDITVENIFLEFAESKDLPIMIQQSLAMMSPHVVKAGESEELRLARYNFFRSDDDKKEYLDTLSTPKGKQFVAVAIRLKHLMMKESSE